MFCWELLFPSLSLFSTCTVTCHMGQRQGTCEGKEVKVGVEEVRLDPLPHWGWTLPCWRPRGGRQRGSLNPPAAASADQLHCSQVPWGPNFEWDGDLMGTFASTNGDQKNDFLKIYLNELIPWNTEEKIFRKTPSQSVASFGVQVYRLKLVLSSQLFKFNIK